MGGGRIREQNKSERERERVRRGGEFAGGVLEMQNS